MPCASSTPAWRRCAPGWSQGGAWNRTVVVVASEFGREVAVNGTLGTDHGTGGAAFVLGGAVRGGRVVADWPGLAKAKRFEGRDLRMTTDLRAVLKGVLGDHLHVASRTLERDVFPAQRERQADRAPARLTSAAIGAALRSAAPWCDAAKPSAAFACASSSGVPSSAIATATPSSIEPTRTDAPAASDSAAASVKLKVCGPITIAQPQAAASIRFWPPSGRKLPPSRATSASA